MNAPKGVQTDGRIGLGLLPEERAVVVEVANEEPKRSMASAARLLVLDGIKYRRMRGKLA